MSQDCTNLMQTVPKVVHSPFEDLGTTLGPGESGGMESMDCSIGKEIKSGPLPRPVVEAWVGGERFEAIIDTGCAHTFIHETLAPGEYVQKATPIQMMCMHRQSTYYPRKVYQVTVLETTKEMTVGVALDLPYLMILGWDWREIYKVLNIMRGDRLGEAGLLGSEEDDPVKEGFNVEWLSCSRSFRNVQEVEEEFWTIKETELAKNDEKMVDPGCYASLPRFEVTRGLLYRIKRGPQDGGRGSSIVNTISI